VAKRGSTAPALLDAEVTAQVGLVSAQESETFDQANKARLQGEEATVREQLRTQLQHQKLAAQWQAFLHSLRSQATVAVATWHHDVRARRPLAQCLASCLRPEHPRALSSPSHSGRPAVSLTLPRLLPHGEPFSRLLETLAGNVSHGLWQVNGPSPRS